MSTLTTRIGGFRFVIRPSDNVWPNGKGVEGRFYADGTDDVMAMPFELRSTYAQSEGQTLALLMAATNDVLDMLANEYFDCYCGEIGNLLCDRCKEARTLMDFANNLI